jgi:antitoxin (DNA-binding transcriptional repressor) of toxin-antitoxin stability system
MSAKHVTLAEANGHLAELLEAVRRGDEIFIEAGNHMQVKLVAVTSVRQARVLGAYRGKLRMRADFNAPLPDDFWLSGHT